MAPRRGGETDRQRRQQEAHDGRDAQRGDDRGQCLHCRRAHSSVSPGTGKRAQMSRTRSLRRAFAGSSSRSRMALDDQVADLAHLRLAEATRGRRRRAHADARRGVGRQRIERDGVLVDSDADGVELLLCFLAGHAQRRDIDEHQVVVRAAADDLRALVGERGRQDPRVVDRALDVGSELVGGGQLQRNGLGRDDVHQRPALEPWEDGLVDLLAQVRAREDESAARAAQRLVGGRGHQVGVRERAGMQACRDQAGDVRHVDDQVCVYRLGDLRHPLEVDDARVGAGTGDDHPWPDLGRLLLQRVVVDLGVLFAYAVGVDLEPLAAEVDRRTVRQVAAVGEVHAQHPVADIEDRDVRRHVCLRAGVGLDVDVLRAGEQRERPLLGESLDLVDELAATVVALAGQALGVLVGQPRALRFEDRREGVVLAGDELDLPALTLALADHGRPKVGIDLGDGMPRRRGWRWKRSRPGKV